ncbi:MAG TPA: hypothetical protein DFM08_14855, partial [Pseudomonas sp.]|nr:hypothetical protein [Pseudomonas sp.]
MNRLSWAERASGSIRIPCLCDLRKAIVRGYAYRRQRRRRTMSAPVNWSVGMLLDIGLNVLLGLA